MIISLSLRSDHIKAGDTVTGLQQQPRGHPPKNPIDQPPATEGRPINSRASQKPDPASVCRLISHRLVFSAELNFTSRALHFCSITALMHQCFNHMPKNRFTEI